MVVTVVLKRLAFSDDGAALILEDHVAGVVAGLRVRKLAQLHRIAFVVECRDQWLDTGRVMIPPASVHVSSVLER